ncbi:MAG: hypothetical protein AAFV43_16715 [Planctomycetota bacterium]
MKRFALLCLTVSGAVATADAATIATGDVTANLDGQLFYDDARTGGGDTTYNEGSVNNIQRYLDFDLDGLITDPPGVEGTVTIEGFGFATSAAAAANDATEIDLSFVYLGADENPGTPGDNVVIGTERVGYNHTGGGEYFVNFDTDLSAVIDGLGSRFRVVIEVVDNDPQVVESIRFKNRPTNEHSFFGQASNHSGPMLSISGTFVPTIPEPSSAAAAILITAFGGVASRRRR